jgi:antimicrobial peptide system SdpB family protein
MNISFSIPIIHTNVYGLSRTFIALGSLITLVFTNSNELFPDTVFEISQNVFKNSEWNLFYIFGKENMKVGYFCGIIILLTVISGFFPQITCLFHTWVSYSIYKGSYIVEGGDQISAILTLLLIPICILDNRKNHWYKDSYFLYKTPDILLFFVICTTWVIRIQMSILYLDAGIEKINVPEWKDGTAIYYWFNHNLFGAPTFLKYLFGSLFTNIITTPLINWGVICFEILLAFGLFMSKDAKKYLFLCAVIFHFFIFMVHGLPSFGCAMVGGLILYLLPLNKDIKIEKKSSINSFLNFNKI